jgi:hypothetical protein
MIWARFLEKLLKVIRGLLRLALKITLGGSYELLIGVASAYIIIVLIVASGDRDSLGPSPWPPLVALGASFCSVVHGCGRSSRAPPMAAFPLFCTKIAPTASLLDACLVAMLRSSLVVFGCSRLSSCTRVRQVVHDQNADITSTSHILGSSCHFWENCWI